MDISNAPDFSETGRARRAAGGVVVDRGSHAAAVSWAAVFAGAAGAAALSLVLLILGTGLGLSAVSPWAQAGASAAAIGVSSIVWITVTQVLASGMGGYLAGRLRTRWHATPIDEVFFRDTAHGFLAWAVATLVTAALLTTAIGAVVGSGVQAGATVAGAAGSAGSAGSAGTAGALAGGSLLVSAAMPRAETGSAGASGVGASPLGYFVDSMFRVDHRAATMPPSPASPPSTSELAIPGLSAPIHSPSAVEFTPAAAAALASEVSRILMNSGRVASLPADDLRYVSQQVAQRTGMSQAEADKRVSDTFARWQATLRETETSARSAADTARKASSYTALWLFVSLLLGAFVASVAATLGGRQRDA